MICTSKSNYSHFLQDTVCLNSFCSLLDFWWYFSSLMCCVTNISPRSCLENLLNIDIRYVDKFILSSFHTYPAQADHCAFILQFFWAPDIQPSSPVISVFYRCCSWFHECISLSLSLLQFSFSVCLCVIVFLFFFLRVLSVEVLVYLKARLNGFNICFNLHSTLCWIKCSVRLNRSPNIVENVKNVESLLKACWIKFKSV